MSDYKLANGGVIRESDSAFIPESIANRDWQVYLIWSSTNTADPAFTLDERRVNRWADIKVECRTKADGLVSYGGNTYSSNDNAQASLETLINAVGRGDLTAPVNVLDSTDTSRSLSLVDMKVIAKGMAKLLQDCIDNAITLKNTVDASQDPEGVVITTGWPTIPYVVT